MERCVAYDEICIVNKNHFLMLRQSHEPRPLGEAIAFYRSSSSTGSAKGKRLHAKTDEMTREYVEALADAQRMEHMYFNFALSDALAVQYRLPELWVRMKKATSGSNLLSASARVVEEDLDSEDVDVDQALSEKYFDKESDSEKEDFDVSNIVNIVLKVDSDIILGTITDALTDKEESTGSVAELNSSSSRSPQLKLVSSGVGEVIGRDVLIANAANGFIFTYNTSVQLEAQRQAARQDVKIVRFRLVKDIIALFNDSKSSAINTAIVKAKADAMMADTSSVKAVREYLNQLSLKSVKR